MTRLKIVFPLHVICMEFQKSLVQSQDSLIISISEVSWPMSGWSGIAMALIGLIWQWLVCIWLY